MTKEEAIKTLCELLRETNESWYEETYNMAIESLKVRSGEWVDDGCVEKCSQCGERKEFPHWKYCPNCGADMTVKR